MTMTDKQEALNQGSVWDFSDLRAMFISCTLKRSPELSHTEGLARISMEIMRRNGVEVELLRAVERDSTRRVPRHDGVRVGEG